MQSFNCGMYVLLSDDKHQMVRDSSKKCTGQCRRNSNPVVILPHAVVVFRMQLFNLSIGRNHMMLPIVEQCYIEQLSNISCPKPLIMLKIDSSPEKD